MAASDNDQLLQCSRLKLSTSHSKTPSRPSSPSSLRPAPSHDCTTTPLPVCCAFEARALQHRHLHEDRCMSCSIFLFFFFFFSTSRSRHTTCWGARIPALVESKHHTHSTTPKAHPSIGFVTAGLIRTLSSGGLLAVQIRPTAGVRPLLCHQCRLWRRSWRRQPAVRVSVPPPLPLPSHTHNVARTFTRHRVVQKRC